jgi:hypothetical protein
MYFKLLGEISDIETFASGAAIREIARYEEFTDEAAGGNVKALLAFD